MPMVLNRIGSDFRVKNCHKGTTVNMSLHAERKEKWIKKQL